MIPVVFIQVWKPCNVAIAINKALETNDVHLIGERDYSNRNCCFHDIAAYEDGVRNWLHVQEKRLERDFETLCMYRWYCVLKLMDEIKTDRVWSCDSDVLLYGNADHEYSLVGNPDMTFSFCPEGRKAGLDYPLGHAGHSIVCRTALEQFVNTKHNQWNDMFAWTNMLRTSSFSVVDTAKPIGQRLWDHHLGNNLRHYDSAHDMKRVRFVNNMPTVKTINGTQYTTPVLHCWGPAEAKMEQLSKCIDLV